MKINYPIGGYAPGNYMSHCVNCDEEFMGDKYAKQCEPCAINAINESHTKALKRIHQMEIALRKIKEGNDLINELLI